MKQNVLVVGSGGREHAIAWKLAQSPRIGKLYMAPGNAGARNIATSIPIKATDIEGLATFAQEHDIGLTVVGPDDPLSLGIVDYFQAKKLRIFGPTQAAARIESDKVFAKQLMYKSGVPTAAWNGFQDHGCALAHVKDRGAPVVVKAAGLALGKGAYVCRTIAEATIALKEIMVDRKHGDAGNQAVIEDFLEGQEISVHVLCDGNPEEDGFHLFPTAQDHKPLLDGDQGPNTGGMGVISPVPWAMGGLTMGSIAMGIVRPILRQLVESNSQFAGLLYPGLMATKQGFKVLEFNARFGDPETQVHMIRLATDLLDVLDACVDGTLSKADFRWHPGFAACVVLASGGYPDAYKKGFPIHGLDEVEKLPGVMVFHAGTTFDGQHFLTAGGRVLGVTARGDTLKQAIDRAYEAAALIHFEGVQYRKDIGAKCL